MNDDHVSLQRRADLHEAARRRARELRDEAFDRAWRAVRAWWTARLRRRAVPGWPVGA